MSRIGGEGFGSFGAVLGADPEGVESGEVKKERSQIRTDRNRFTVDDSVKYTELTRLRWQRDLAFDSLEGRSLTLVRGHEVGRMGDEKNLLCICLDPPIKGWNTEHNWAKGGTRIETGYSNTPLFGLTNGKMLCPSLSLPAGAPEIGGTCPGATAGQYGVQPARQEKAAEVALEVAHRSRIKLPTINLSTAICNECYATGGNISRYADNRLDQIVRHWFFVSVLRQKGKGALADILSEGVQSLIEAEPEVGSKDSKSHFKPDKQGLYYFRIHDSGDFFETDYADAWVATAHQFPMVRFWAPTRTWVVKAWERYWGSIRMPDNLIVRPSAYHFGDAAPDVPHLAGGSTSLLAHQSADGRITEPDLTGKAGWSCRTYYVEAEESKNCLTALSPDGKRGCRACWNYPVLSVNYTAH